MLRNARRFYDIIRIVIFYRLDEFLPTEGIFRWIRYGAYLHPAHYRRNDENLSRGARLRLALENLGPIFVKLGQTLSTRPDLIPADIAAELNLLQDRVPPFPGAQARAIIEESLGDRVENLFADFDDRALASASVAQVHSATLESGEQVVVKVLRPNVEKQVARDIALMYLLARFAARTRDGRRLRPLEVVREFEYTMENELDLMNEAAAASQLRANFDGSPLLHVPKIYWTHCRSRVLVQERIFYLNINEQEAMQAAGVNMRVLGERGVEIFFTQVFRDSFFHADMHPGNILVGVGPEDFNRYIALDFGIVGTLSETDKRYLAQNFLAFFKRDYRRVADLHIESGWVPADTRAEELEGAVRACCEPMFDRPLREISLGVVLMRLFQASRRFNVEIQPQLVLLQKTLLNVEGLGRQLNPDLDLWVTAQPILEVFIKKQVGWAGFESKLQKEAPRWAQQVPELPRLLHAALQRQAHPQMDAEQKQLLERIALGQRRTLRWLQLAVLILTGLLALQLWRHLLN